MVEKLSNYGQHRKAKALSIMNTTITHIIQLIPNILQGVQYFDLYQLRQH